MRRRLPAVARSAQSPERSPPAVSSLSASDSTVSRHLLSRWCSMRVVPPLVLLVLVLAGAATASCPSEEWQEFFGVCYWSSPFNMTWSSVASACGSMFPGARPVSVHDYTTNSFLSDRLMHRLPAWMGLCCEGDCEDVNQFSWLDNSPLNWTYWTETAFYGNGSRCAYINAYSNQLYYGKWSAEIVDDRYDEFPVMCQIP